MSDKQTQTIEISTKTIITTIMVILGLLLMYQVRSLILLFLVAVTLASALEPMVAWSNHRLKLPRSLTVTLVYLVVLGAVGSFFYTVAPSIVSQFQDLTLSYENFVQKAVESTGPAREVVERLGITDDLSSFYQYFAGVSQDAFKTTLGVVTGLLQFIAILVISFYLVIDQRAIRDTIRQLAPPNQRDKIARIVDVIQKKLGFWLLGQLVLSALVFLLTFLLLSLLNMPFALALAALAGILEIVPFLGPIIAAVPAILIAFTVSPTKALLVTLAYVLIQQAESYIFAPKIMHKAVGVHPLLVLFGVLIGFNLTGIIGALLAVPVLAASSVLAEVYIAGNAPKEPGNVEDMWRGHDLRLKRLRKHGSE